MAETKPKGDPGGAGPYDRGETQPDGVDAEAVQGEDDLDLAEGATVPEDRDDPRPNCRRGRPGRFDHVYEQLHLSTHDRSTSTP